MMWWLNTFVCAFVVGAPDVPLIVRIAFAALSAISLFRALGWGRGR